MTANLRGVESKCVLALIMPEWHGASKEKEQLLTVDFTIQYSSPGTSISTTSVHRLAPFWKSHVRRICSLQ